jgi:hypothetical protein
MPWPYLSCEIRAHKPQRWETWPDERTKAKPPGSKWMSSPGTVWRFRYYIM